MTTYQVEQIRRFLEAVDEHLRKRARLVIIGGGAALLQHGARSPTRVIDAYAGDTPHLRQAAAEAEAEIGFAVPIGSAAVAELPLHYEDRQLHPMPHLKRLDVVVPERHDLVLSKLVRASHADLVVCREMHEHRALDAGVLVKRHLDEMEYAIGRQADRDLNFVAGVEFIWDATTADRAQRRIDERRSHRSIK
jgi:Nucleotidyltransferase of unknown function (DUF6036)